MEKHCFQHVSYGLMDAVQTTAQLTPYVAWISLPLQAVRLELTFKMQKLQGKHGLPGGARSSLKEWTWLRTWSGNLQAKGLIPTLLGPTQVFQPLGRI